MEKVTEFLQVSSGSGYGCGSGYGIANFCGRNVYQIDGIPTVIYSVRGNLAKGAILQEGLTLCPCWVAKVEDYFAHGDTAREAIASAREKAVYNLDEAGRIAIFKQECDAQKRYPVMDFFRWHHLLTLSCEFGRREFARQHDIDLENDDMNLAEFIALTKDVYGGDIIRRVEKALLPPE